MARSCSYGPRAGSVRAQVLQQDAAANLLVSHIAEGLQAFHSSRSPATGQTADNVAADCALRLDMESLAGKCRNVVAAGATRLCDVLQAFMEATARFETNLCQTVPATLRELAQTQGCEQALQCLGSVSLPTALQKHKMVLANAKLLAELASPKKFEEEQLDWKELIQQSKKFLLVQSLDSELLGSYFPDLVETVASFTQSVSKELASALDATEEFNRQASELLGKYRRGFRFVFML